MIEKGDLRLRSAVVFVVIITVSCLCTATAGKGIRILLRVSCQGNGEPMNNTIQISSVFSAIAVLNPSSVEECPGGYRFSER
jgi:hypothetical protein